MAGTKWGFTITVNSRAFDALTRRTQSFATVTRRIEESVNSLVSSIPKLDAAMTNLVNSGGTRAEAVLKMVEGLQKDVQSAAQGVEKTTPKVRPNLKTEQAASISATAFKDAIRKQLGISEGDFNAIQGKDTRYNSIMGGTPIEPNASGKLSSNQAMTLNMRANIALPIVRAIEGLPAKIAQQLNSAKESGGNSNMVKALNSLSAGISGINERLNRFENNVQKTVNRSPSMIGHTTAGPPSANVKPDQVPSLMRREIMNTTGKIFPVDPELQKRFFGSATERNDAVDKLLAMVGKGSGVASPISDALLEKISKHYKIEAETPGTQSAAPFEFASLLSVLRAAKSGSLGSYVNDAQKRMEDARDRAIARGKSIKYDPNTVMAERVVRNVGGVFNNGAPDELGTGMLGQIIRQLSTRIIAGISSGGGIRYGPSGGAPYNTLEQVISQLDVPASTKGRRPRYNASEPYSLLMSTRGVGGSSSAESTIESDVKTGKSGIQTVARNDSNIEEQITPEKIQSLARAFATLLQQASSPLPGMEKMEPKERAALREKDVIRRISQQGTTGDFVTQAKKAESEAISGPGKEVLRLEFAKGLASDERINEIASKQDSPSAQKATRRDLLKLRTASPVHQVISRISELTGANEDELKKEITRGGKIAKDPLLLLQSLANAVQNTIDKTSSSLGDTIKAKPIKSEKSAKNIPSNPEPEKVSESLFAEIQSVRDLVRNSGFRSDKRPGFNPRVFQAFITQRMLAAQSEHTGVWEPEGFVKEFLKKNSPDIHAAASMLTGLDPSVVMASLRTKGLKDLERIAQDQRFHKLQTEHGNPEFVRAVPDITGVLAESTHGLPGGGVAIASDIHEIAAILRMAARTYLPKIVADLDKWVVANKGKGYEGMPSVDAGGRVTMSVAEAAAAQRSMKPSGYLASLSEPAPVRHANYLSRVMAWGLSGALVYGGVNAAQSSVKTMSDYDTQTMRSRKVMNPLTADNNKLADAAAEISQKYGHGLNDTLSAMASFAEQGRDVADVIRMTDAAMVAANVTNLTSSEAIDGIVSAQKQFKMSTGDVMHIIDAWNAVENTTAASAKTLAEATMHSASAAREAGIDFDTFNGIVAALGESTRQSGSEIGSSLRYILTNVKTPAAVKTLQEVGIYATNASGQFKSVKNIVGELSGKWNELTAAQKQQIGVGIAGVRQMNSFFALVENWDRAMDVSSTSLMSQGSAMRENEMAMKTLASQIGVLRASWEGLLGDFAKSGALDSLKQAVELLREVVKLVGGANQLSHGVLGGAATSMAIAGIGFGAASHFGMNILPGAVSGALSPDYIAFTELERSRRRQSAMKAVAEGMSAPGQAGQVDPRLLSDLLNESSRGGSASTAKVAGVLKQPGNVGFTTPGGHRFEAPKNILIGAGLITAGSLAKAYGPAPDEFGHVTAASTATDVISSGLGSAGFASLFTKPGTNPLTPSGFGAQSTFGKVAIGATIIGFSLQAASSIRKAYEQARPQALSGLTPDLRQLAATDEKISQALSSIKQFQRGERGGSNEADVSFFTDMRDLAAALSPSSVKLGKNGRVEGGSLDEFASGLGGTASEIRKNRAGLQSFAVNAQLESPINKEAIDKLANLLRERAELRSRGASTEDSLKNYTKIRETRAILEDNFINPVRGLAQQAGRARTGITGLTGENITRNAAKLDIDPEMLAKDIVKYSLRGSTGGLDVDVEKALKGTGLSAQQFTEKGFYQTVKGGPTYKFSTNEVAAYTEEQTKALERQNAVILRAYESVKGTAILPADEISKLVSEYGRAIDRMSHKNQNLIESVDFLNQTIAQASLANTPEKLVASGLGLSSNRSSVESLAKIQREGIQGFATPSENNGNPGATQSRIRSMIGDITGQSFDSPGLSIKGIIDAQRNLSNEVINKIRADISSRVQSAVNDKEEPVSGNEQGNFSANIEVLKQMMPEGRIDDFLSQVFSVRNLAAKANAIQDPKQRDAAKQEVKTKTGELQNTVLSDFFGGQSHEQIQQRLDSILRSDLKGFRDAASRTLQELGDSFEHLRATGQGSNVNTFLNTTGSENVRVNRELAGFLQEGVGKAQENLKAAEATGNKSDIERAQIYLDQIRKVSEVFEVFRRPVEELGKVVYSVSAGMKDLQRGVSVTSALANNAGAYGSTGLNANQFAIDTLTKAIAALKPGDPNAIENTAAIKALTEAIDQQKTEFVVQTALRNQSRQGLYSAGVSGIFGGSLGLQGGGAGVQQFVQAQTAQMQEILQQIARQAGPSLQGKDIGQIRSFTDQISKIFAKPVSGLRQLNDVSDASSYVDLLTSPASTQAIAEQIKAAIAQGFSASDILANPYTKDAVRGDPTLRKLIEPAASNELFLKAMDFNSQYVDQNTGALKDLAASLDAVAEVFKSVLGKSVNPADLVPKVSVPNGPDGTKIPEIPKMAEGSMSLAGSAAVDSKGRIRKDGTLAVLHEGEVVLNKQQSKAMAQNHYAKGTLPQGRKPIEDLLGHYTHTLIDRSNDEYKVVGAVQGDLQDTYSTHGMYQSREPFPLRASSVNVFDRNYSAWATPSIKPGEEVFHQGNFANIELLEQWAKERDLDLEGGNAFFKELTRGFHGEFDEEGISHVKASMSDLDKLSGAEQIPYVSPRRMVSQLRSRAQSLPNKIDRFAVIHSLPYGHSTQRSSIEPTLFKGEAGSSIIDNTNEFFDLMIDRENGHPPEGALWKKDPKRPKSIFELGRYDFFNANKELRYSSRLIAAPYRSDIDSFMYSVNNERLSHEMSRRFTNNLDTSAVITRATPRDLRFFGSRLNEPKELAEWERRSFLRMTNVLNEASNIERPRYEGSALPVEAHGSVPKHAIEQAHSILDAVPEDALEKIIRQGGKAHLFGGSPEDYSKFLVSSGISSNLTQNPSGIYNPKISQFAIHQNSGSGRIYQIGNPGDGGWKRTFSHELGHAVDHTSGWLSDNDRKFNRISSNENKRLIGALGFDNKDIDPTTYVDPYQFAHGPRIQEMMKNKDQNYLSYFSGLRHSSDQRVAAEIFAESFAFNTLDKAGVDPNSLGEMSGFKGMFSKAYPKSMSRVAEMMGRTPAAVEGMAFEDDMLESYKMVELTNDDPFATASNILRRDSRESILKAHKALMRYNGGATDSSRAFRNKATGAITSSTTNELLQTLDNSIYGLISADIGSGNGAGAITSDLIRASSQEDVKKILKANSVKFPKDIERLLSHRKEAKLLQDLYGEDRKMPVIDSVEGMSQPSSASVATATKPRGQINLSLRAATKEAMNNPKFLEWAKEYGVGNDFREPSFGNFGMWQPTGNKRGVKFTFRPDEAETVSQVIGIESPYWATNYAQAEVGDHEGQKLYAVIREELEKGNDSLEKAAWMVGHSERQGKSPMGMFFADADKRGKFDSSRAITNRMMTLPKHLRSSEGASIESSKYMRQIFHGVSDLYNNHGIKYYDIHSGNVMLKDGRAAFAEMGHSQVMDSARGEEPLIMEKLGLDLSGKATAFEGMSHVEGLPGEFKSLRENLHKMAGKIEMNPGDESPIIKLFSEDPVANTYGEMVVDKAKREFVKRSKRLGLTEIQASNLLNRTDIEVGKTPLKNLMAAYKRTSLVSEGTNAAGQELFSMSRPKIIIQSVGGGISPTEGTIGAIAHETTHGITDPVRIMMDIVSENGGAKKSNRLLRQLIEMSMQDTSIASAGSMGEAMLYPMQSLDPAAIGMTPESASAFNYIGETLEEPAMAAKGFKNGAAWKIFSEYMSSMAEYTSIGKGSQRFSKLPRNIQRFMPELIKVSEEVSKIKGMSASQVRNVAERSVDKLSSKLAKMGIRGDDSVIHKMSAMARGMGQTRAVPDASDTIPEMSPTPEVAPPKVSLRERLFNSINPKLKSIEGGIANTYRGTTGMAGRAYEATGRGLRSARGYASGKAASAWESLQEAAAEAEAMSNARVQARAAARPSAPANKLAARSSRYKDTLAWALDSAVGSPAKIGNTIRKLPSRFNDRMMGLGKAFQGWSERTPGKVMSAYDRVARLNTEIPDRMVKAYGATADYVYSKRGLPSNIYGRVSSYANDKMMGLGKAFQGWSERTPEKIMSAYDRLAKLNTEVPNRMVKGYEAATEYLYSKRNLPADTIASGLDRFFGAGYKARQGVASGASALGRGITNGIGATRRFVTGIPEGLRYARDLASSIGERTVQGTSNLINEGYGFAKGAAARGIVGSVNGATKAAGVIAGKATQYGGAAASGFESLGGMRTVGRGLGAAFLADLAYRGGGHLGLWKGPGETYETYVGKPLAAIGGVQMSQQLLGFGGRMAANTEAAVALRGLGVASKALGAVGLAYTAADTGRLVGTLPYQIAQATGLDETRAAHAIGYNSTTYRNISASSEDLGETIATPFTAVGAVAQGAWNAAHGRGFSGGLVDNFRSMGDGYQLLMQDYDQQFGRGVLASVAKQNFGNAWVLMPSLMRDRSLQEMVSKQQDATNAFGTILDTPVWFLANQEIKDKVMNGMVGGDSSAERSTDWFKTRLEGLAEFKARSRRQSESARLFFMQQFGDKMEAWPEEPKQLYSGIQSFESRVGLEYDRIEALQRKGTMRIGGAQGPKLVDLLGVGEFISGNDQQGFHEMLQSGGRESLAILSQFGDFKADDKLREAWSTAADKLPYHGTVKDLYEAASGKKFDTTELKKMFAENLRTGQPQTFLSAAADVQAVTKGSQSLEGTFATHADAVDAISQVFNRDSALRDAVANAQKKINIEEMAARRTSLKQAMDELYNKVNLGYSGKADTSIIDDAVAAYDAQYPNLGSRVQDMLRESMAIQLDAVTPVQDAWEKMASSQDFRAAIEKRFKFPGDPVSSLLGMDLKDPRIQAQPILEENAALVKWRETIPTTRESWRKAITGRNDVQAIKDARKDRDSYLSLKKVTDIQLDSDGQIVRDENGRVQTISATKIDGRGGYEFGKEAEMAKTVAEHNEAFDRRKLDGRDILKRIGQEDIAQHPASIEAFDAILDKIYPGLSAQAKIYEQYRYDSSYTTGKDAKADAEIFDRQKKDLEALDPKFTMSFFEELCRYRREAESRLSKEAIRKQAAQEELNQIRDRIQNTEVKPYKQNVFAESGITGEEIPTVKRHGGGPTPGGEFIAREGEMVVTEQFYTSLFDSVKELRELILQSRYQTDPVATDAGQFMSMQNNDVKVTTSVNHSGSVVIEMGDSVQDTLAKILELLQKQSGQAPLKTGDKLLGPNVG